MNKKTENKQHWITSGFIVLLGILLILLSMLLDFNYIPNIVDVLRVPLTILSKAFTSCGISLIVGFTTSKIRANEEKNKKIENIKLLENVIISKEFLQTLSDTSKQDIIAKLLTPENSTLNKHSNIKEYLDTKTDKYLKFFDINFRSHFSITVTVYKDTKLNKFVGKYKMIHRIYKINKKYEPICITFQDPTSEIISTKIKYDNKTIIDVKNSDYEFVDNKYQYVIPDALLDYNFLVVEREVIEYGQSHWIALYWKSLTPIEGIDYRVDCKSGIVKSYNIFDNEDLYCEPELSADRKSFRVESSKWLDPYTGISVVVANESTDDNLN